MAHRLQTSFIILFLCASACLAGHGLQSCHAVTFMLVIQFLTVQFLFDLTHLCRVDSPTLTF